MVRQGLAGILRSRGGFEIAAESGDGEQAIAQYLVHRPDVLLLDLRMPRLDGLGVVTRVRSADPAARILIVTTYDTDEDITRSLRAGARGYLLKDAPADEIVAAVAAVARGELYLPAPVAAKFVASASRPELTPREQQILTLIAAGHSNKEIGRALRIEETTVKTHVKSLFTKLSVSSRTEALAEAARRGIGPGGGR
jgi:two-component system NarL family response regulator